jgi:hypothetical protein
MAAARAEQIPYAVANDVYPLDRDAQPVKRTKVGTNLLAASNVNCNTCLV